VAVFSIPVVEGPEYRLGPDVVFSGNVRVPEEELTIGLPEAGIVFEPELVETSTDVIYQHYWQRGFSDATVDTSIVRRRDTGIVDLVFEIDENRRDRIDEIEITGNNRTSENLIRNQIALDAGQYLDIRTLGTARRNLYNTGAYTLVDVEPVDVDDAARGEATPGDGDAGVRLRISVREVPPYSFRYGAFYDTERGPGGTIDLRNQNSLGSARTIGLRLRYDGRLREARTFFSQPALPRLPFQTNTGLFLREERKADRVTRDIGADLQQEVRLGSEFIVTYGYSFLHSRSFHRDDETNTIDDAPFDVSNVAPLSLTLTRDTRDDLLDASRGTFMTHSIEFAPRMLGSDDGLVRYFGQYFRYRALSEPVQIPYSGGRQKARFVYAVGARLGLAAGLDGSEVPPGERFFAGGGTTIRGFEQDAVGPMGFRDGELVPIGGGGVLVVNNELRFPLVNIFDGVAFLDIGNVYESVRDFDPFHLRSSAGVGLRVRTPFFLLRADYGFNLTRKPGEPSGTFFFSIGQAF
jgi:outer membrane protein assembly complex protein YaeT